MVYGAMSDRPTATFGIGRPDAGPDCVRQFHLEVVEGPARGTTWSSRDDVCVVGSHPLCNLRVDDDTVSRFHCELRVVSDGVIVTDTGSRNGTFVDGVRVVHAYLRDGSLVRLGRTVVRFEFGVDSNRLSLSDRRSFGILVGESPAMRQVFAYLERAAATDATVLIEGETGTGKTAAARSLHMESARRDGPFVTVDCGALPPTLLESELFGHERGAFTGADVRRIGAFEEASGGTLFLDEIGELPLELQPKLLGVLENRQIRRVGGTGAVDVDVRICAATNRDLRAEVNAGRFRSDLYYRLAVVHFTLPPLRRRPEDVPALARAILQGLGAPDDRVDALLAPDRIARLQRAAWPGNTRELKNYLERCLVFDDMAPVAGPVDAAPPPVDASVPFADARRRAIDQFERAYVEDLLRRHGGRVTEAAVAAGVDRTYIYRLLRRHRLAKPGGAADSTSGSAAR
ncbi:MAG: FHA domain-containing protein [Deltaproteobacteria bacterium]|nr:MAG: FHA domain-containing protein [Deltaproteobacteria bacterium]